MQDKCLFIVNPKSGRGKGIKAWPRIEKTLQSIDCTYTCEFTQSKFHASEIVQKGIENGNKRIIAIGGDGTLHECLNGIYTQQHIDPKEITLGIYPVGTGNDWIKSHPVPRKFDEWIAYFKNGRTVYHDVGKVMFQKEDQTEARYFINIAGLGFEAAAVERACRKGNELLGGKIYYLLVVAKTLFSYKSQKMKIAIDNEVIEGSKFCVTVGINKYNGGGMQLLPKADSADGLFDVAVIDDISVGEVLINLPKLYNGKIVDHPKVKSTRAQSIKISSNEEVMIEADGEFLGATDAQFEIIKQGLKIMVV